MNPVERRLYGEYPSPMHTYEHANSYAVQPRQGPDNVALMMSGWSNVQPTNNLPQPKPQLPPPGVQYSPQAAQLASQLAAAPMAGVATNPNYNVYAPQAAPAAGQYRSVHAQELPRGGRGMYAGAGMHDNLTQGEMRLGMGGPRCTPDSNLGSYCFGVL